jgi:hypothetical protein
MAVTITSVTPTAPSAVNQPGSPDSKIVDITIDDTTASTVTIPHGLRRLLSAPQEVTLTALRAEGLTSQWYAGTIDTTNVILTRAVLTASSSGAQLRVIIKRPHSIGR